MSSRQPGLLSDTKWSCIHKWSHKYTSSTSDSEPSRSTTSKSSSSISSISSCVASGTGISVPSSTAEGSGSGTRDIQREILGEGLRLPELSLLPRLLGLPELGGMRNSTSGIDGPPKCGTDGTWFLISSIVSWPTRRNWTKQIWVMFSCKEDINTRLQGVKFWYIISSGEPCNHHHKTLLST